MDIWGNFSDETKWAAVENEFYKQIGRKIQTTNLTQDELKVATKLLPKMFEILKDFEKDVDYWVDYYELTNEEIEEFDDEDYCEDIESLEEREYYNNILAPQLSDLNRR